MERIKTALVIVRVHIFFGVKRILSSMESEGLLFKLYCELDKYIWNYECDASAKKGVQDYIQKIIRCFVKAEAVSLFNFSLVGMLELQLKLNNVTRSIS